ncbi:MAG: hypothetical protein GY771_02690 [bacterium]|nr:hypothetical protein [bacterium]
MRTLTTLILSALLLATSVCAAETNGWDEGLFWWEAGAGLLGAGVGAGLGLAVGQDDIATVAFVLGNAGGVIFVGEHFGVKSKNWYLTCPLTAITSMAYPVLMVLAMPALFSGLEGDGGFDAINSWLVLTAISDPLVTAVVYNSLKRPEMPEKSLDTGFDIKPYATYLADSGGDLVPVYGVSVSF